MSEPATISHRRQRIHELVLALLAQHGDLELLDGDAGAPPAGDAGQWIERNRRVVQRYQALVRSAVTLDALIDQEVGEGTTRRIGSGVQEDYG
jgi:hypothetical protein